MLWRDFPINVLTLFPESLLEFVRVNVEFWREVLLIDIRDRSQKVWKKVNKSWQKIRGQGRRLVKFDFN